LDEDDPKVLAIVDNLAITLRALGVAEEDIETRNRRVLGQGRPQHPCSSSNLAADRKALGQTGHSS